jgi:hypothetical protein
MVQIPEQQQLTPEQAFEQLQVWYGLQQQLANLRNTEFVQRGRMASFYFTDPNEGTNRIDLGGGFDLKLDYKINRNVDEAALLTVTAEQAKALALPMDKLFKWKPELSVTEYRKLNDKQREFVDSLLDIKPGSPSLSIVPKADTAGQQAHAAAAEAQAAPDAYDINLGKEEDTEPNQFFKDGDGVWWLLNDESEWVELEPLDDIIPKLEAQVAAMTAKPKRTRKPRTAKAGGK